MSKISLLAEIKRKTADLPRFVEVADTVIEAWHLEGTTPIEVQIEGGEPLRRSLKRWGKGRPVWFFELTNPICKKAGVNTGDTVEFILARADERIAAEIEIILTNNLEAQAKWDEATPSQRRMLNEHVLAGKQAATRERRARKALGVDSTLD